MIFFPPKLYPHVKWFFSPSDAPFLCAFTPDAAQSLQRICDVTAGVLHDK